MQILRRLLYVPIIIVLVGALLIIFNVIDLDMHLPISIEWVVIIAGSLLTVLGIADMRANTAYELPEPEDPPRSTKVIYPKALEETVDSLKKAEEFAVKANGRVDIEIDIEQDPEEK